MSTYEGAERRRAGRTKLVTSCPTFFTLEGTEHEALMTDVSMLGGAFRVELSRGGLSLRPGDTLELTIRTPYGPSECKGKVVWSKKTDEFCTWGMQFTDLSQDEKDPLRCFMDSSF